MCGSDVAGEDCGVDFCVVPFPSVHGVGEFRAVNANLPGKKTIGFQFGLAEFADGGFVVARQESEREATVLFQIEKLILPLGGSFLDGDERIVHMVDKSVRLPSKNGRRSAGRVSIARLTMSLLALLPQGKAADGKMADAHVNPKRLRIWTRRDIPSEPR